MSGGPFILRPLSRLRGGGGRERATTGFGALSAIGRVSAVILGVYLLLVLVGPLLSSAEPNKISFGARLIAPGADAWFGTDELGRDLFIRILEGSRTSLLAGVAIVIPAAAFGVLMGTIAGYFGGVVDGVIMRVTDLFLAFPYLILALAVAAILGPSLQNAIISLIVVFWPSYTRIARGLVISIKQETFVTAARAMGASNTRIIRREVLPHAWSPLQTKLLVDFGYSMISLASLSFIGLGAQPPTAELGALILQARQHVLDAWWYGVWPGLFLLIPVVTLNLVGDAIQDRRDARAGGAR
jgi:peptide/nickel transport system permease protein